jgi:phage gp16-like protein
MSTAEKTVPDRAAAIAARLEQRRKAAIKAVKVCQRQLCLDDETYRAMLQARTGKRSAADLSVTELGVVLDHLRHSGAKHAPQGVHADGRKRGTPAADRAELYKKVIALLQELQRTKGTPHTLAYADAICQRNGWCTRVDFANCNVLHHLVGALNRNLRSAQAAARKKA